MVSSLETVNYVYINDNETPIDLINKINQVTIVGSDYMNFSKDVTGNIKKEVDAIKKVGGKIILQMTYNFLFNFKFNFNSSKI